MKQKTVVIIDDEPFARDDLRCLLLEHPQVEVIGEAGSVKEAQELLSRTSPDIVFLDIQLRGGSGFDLLSGISAHSDIIFFSASDGFEKQIANTNAADYLLKPVSPQQLKLSFQKLGIPG